jgi:hypothetical protein
MQGSQNVPATRDFAVYLKIYRAWVFQQFLCLCELLIYIFLSITFTIAINQTLTNPPFSKYI